MAAGGGMGSGSPGTWRRRMLKKAVAPSLARAWAASASPGGTTASMYASPTAADASPAVLTIGLGSRPIHRVTRCARPTVTPLVFTAGHFLRVRAGVYRLSAPATTEFL